MECFQAIPLSLERSMFPANRISKVIFSSCCLWHVCQTWCLLFDWKGTAAWGKLWTVESMWLIVVKYSREPGMVDLFILEKMWMKKSKMYGTHAWCELFVALAVNLIWRRLRSRANVFTCFRELQCLNLTRKTHMLMISPTVVAAFLIPAQLPFIAPSFSLAFFLLSSDVFLVLSL